MRHTCSATDREFRDRVEACALPAAAFDHRAHVRLAYVYLTEHEPDGAYARMRTALRTFLDCNGVDPAKYHETITLAWIRAVRHFMEMTPGCGNADEFIDRNPKLLDSRIMLTHYSAATLFSAEARTAFVPPDLDPIPEYDPSS